MPEAVINKAGFGRVTGEGRGYPAQFVTEPVFVGSGIAALGAGRKAAPGIIDQGQSAIMSLDVMGKVHYAGATQKETCRNSISPLREPILLCRI